MTAEEALLLADRLSRGAHLVLETGEDLRDAEREYQRLSRAHPRTIRTAERTGLAPSLSRLAARHARGAVS